MKTRRGFLTTALTGSLVLSGCTSLVEPNPKTNIKLIRVVNSNQKRHEVRTVLMRQDSVVFADQQTANAQEDEVTGGYVLSEGWKKEPGKHTIAVKIDDSPWRQRTLENPEGSDCLSVIIRIQDDGEGVILTQSGRTCPS